MLPVSCCIRPIVPICFLLLCQALFGQKTPIRHCYEKQVASLKGQYAELQYSEKTHELEHSFRPWQETEYLASGTLWTGPGNFCKSDTLRAPSGRVYYSSTQADAQRLLFRDYGDTALYPVTRDMQEEQLVQAARYSPVRLIAYFAAQKISNDRNQDKDWILYKDHIGQIDVQLYIDARSFLLKKVALLSHDELFGDVQTSFDYEDYAQVGQFFYPQKIRIGKINGKLKDEVQVTGIKLRKDLPELLKAPADYRLAEKKEQQPDISVSRYSERIHFIDLKHAEIRSMLVEFDDFLLLAEAPLNSKNGELILQEARKIAPHKPLKYVVFTHYHPHYTGGLRPLIHAGAQVICRAEDEDYIRYLAEAPRSLQSDSLYLDPKPVQFESVGDKKVLRAGDWSMEIHWLGNRSMHTDDYLMYYFPAEKMLFQGDLVWIPTSGDIPQAGKRQSGVYQAIKDLGLAVDTIVQSWPVPEGAYKVVIPFGDLEKSVELK